MAKVLIGNVAYKPAVGMHHIQFSGEPTPAEIWAGTTWVIDTDYQGRTLIGSGGAYTLGATGGEETHILTVSEMPEHRHSLGLVSAGTFGVARLCSSSGSGENMEPSPNTQYEGSSQPHNNMPPYTVVNYWKRTA